MRRMLLRITYNAESSNKLLRGHIILIHHFGDEVGSHANTSQERDDLEQADDLEGSTKGTIVRSSHRKK